MLFVLGNYPVFSRVKMTNVPFLDFVYALNLRLSFAFIILFHFFRF